MGKNITILLVAIVIIAAIAGFFWLTQEPDIQVARKVFAGLINGDLSIKNSIDWASFQSVGTDVGSDYTALPNAQEKETYGKSFIANFSIAFSNYAIKFASFTNWRVYKRGKASTIVAVNIQQNKVLLFTVSNQSGKRKVTSIQWKENK
jgi:lysyl-tRNA synthetase class I